MPERRAAPERRIRAIPPLPGIRGYSCHPPLFLAVEIGRDLLAGLDQALHCRCRFFEHRALAAIELDFDDALNALGADNDRHADIEILDSIFAIEPGGAGQNTSPVAQIDTRHRTRARRRSLTSPT